MNDKINLDDILDLGKYDYPEETSFDLDEILGISVPEIETDIVSAAKTTESEAPKVEIKESPVIEEKSKVEEKKPPEVVIAENKPEEKASPEIENVIVETPQHTEEKEISIVSGKPVEPLIHMEDDATSDEPIFQAPAAGPAILFDDGSDSEEQDRMSWDAPVSEILFAEEGEHEEEPVFAEPPVVETTEPMAPESQPEEEPKARSKKGNQEFHFNVAAFDEVKAKSKAEATKQDFVEFVSDPAEEPATPDLFAPEEETVVTEETEQSVSEAPAQEEIKEETEARKNHKPQVIEEYSSIDEREDVLAGLKSLMNKITVKIAVMVLLFLGSIYLFFGLFEQFAIILPAQIRPLEHPANYCLIALALSALYILLNISPLLDGFKKVFRGHLNTDGVSLVLGIASLIYNVYFLLNPDKFAALPISFDFFLGLTLLMNLFGKRLLVKHIYCNFELISEDGLKAAIGRPKSSAVDNDVMVETGNGGDVLYAARTKTISNYLNRAFAEQNVSQKVDVFTFVVFALIAFFGLTCWLFKVMPLSELMILEMALVSVAATVFAGWTHTLYVYKLGVFLRRNRTMISGRDGALAISESGVLVVEDTDLLSCDDIGLCGMQIKSGYDVAEILVTLSALFQKVGGPLNGFFSKILDEQADIAFPTVYEPYYHEQLGYTFSANDRHMAVGNEEFMRQLHIEMPDYSGSDDEHIVYVAVDNVLAGIFSISYRLSAKAAHSLKLLEGEGISVAIISKDFNLREELFTSAVSDPEIITLLSTETAAACERCCSEVPKASADIVTYEHIRGMSCGLVGCSHLLSSCAKHIAYRVTSTIFGVVAVSAVLFLGASNPAILPLQILLYHILWNLPNVVSALKVKF